MHVHRTLEAPFASAPRRQAPPEARPFRSKLATLAILALLLLGGLGAIATCNAPQSTPSVAPSPVPGPLD